MMKYDENAAIFAFGTANIELLDPVLYITSNNSYITYYASSYNITYNHKVNSHIKHYISN